jgi:small-conductance mechanosensitive channel
MQKPQHCLLSPQANRPLLKFGVLLFALWLAPLLSFAAEMSVDSYYPINEKQEVASKPSKGKDNKDSEEWQALDQRLAAIEKQMAAQQQGDEQLGRWLREVTELKRSIDASTVILEAQQVQLDSELGTLGEPVENESAEISKQRKQIQQRKSDLAGRLSGYKLVALHAEELTKKLSAERQRVLTEQFLSRGPGTVGLLKEDTAMIWRWPGAAWRFIVSQSGLQALERLELTGLGVVLFAALAFGGLLRRKLRLLAERISRAEYRIASVLLAGLGHYAPHLLFASATAVIVVLAFPTAPRPFLFRFGITLPLFFLSWAVLHFMFVGREGNALFELPKRVARGFAWSFKGLVLLIYSGNLILSSEITKQMSGNERLLVQDVYVLAVVLVLLWALHYSRPLLLEKGLRGVYGLLFLAMLTTLVGELLGYRNFAYWVLRALFGTVFLFGVFWLVTRLLGEFFAGLQSGRIWWLRSMRQLLGYRDDERMPWLVWVRAVAVVALWLAFALVTLRLWGVSAEALERLYGYFFDGFPLGSLTVVPARIAVAVLMLAALLAFSGWVRKSLETRWLVGSGMERGTREAMVTMSGYAGAAVAILVALSVAGVQFTNLAIIAGALSVGIGFGLQNIVNNFVSGLILLFERPVKTGDWIIVGGTEGYVKRISIRSTLIQTFDRADVIVPNSELISGQVTNWMLFDPRGRVRIPVGIAYGSDTALVKEVLLRIAAEHPRIISDGSATEPKVLFMSFGDSSLNFELRAFIQNIDERLQVISDVNFAIDAAFRERGIEIPFPQRDLHVRSWQKPAED